MDSGEWAVAPSTPKPPARLTAATTSRQWLKASRGNSIPSMSQIGDFMVVLAPCGSFSALLYLVLKTNASTTLAYQGCACQARQRRRPHPDGATAPPHHEGRAFRE